jgi:drug/metabolite transporter (DMT)-like permease
MPTSDIAEAHRSALSPMGLAFVLVWCTGYLAGKMAVAHGGALTTLVWRFGLASLVFIALATLARVPWGPRRALGHSAVVGVLSLALQFAGVYLGLRWGASAGMAALVIGTMPLAVAFVAVASGSERLRALQWLGFVVGFGGVLLVVADRVDGATAWPAWLALGVGLVGVSAGTLYQKRYASTIDLRVGLAVQNIAATLVLLPFALLLEHFAHERSLDYFLPVMWMVLVNSVGGFALLFVLIRRGAASAVAALFFLMPPVTALLGQVVLDEHLTVLKLCGFACAAAGVWLATRAAPAHR